MRELALQPSRQVLLDQGEAQGRLTDIRYRLRVCFQPNFELYRDGHDTSYLKLHAAYRRLWLRLKSVGTMFLSALIQHFRR